MGIELRNQSVCIELPPPQNSNKSAANMINKEKQRIAKTRSTALNAIDWYGSDGRMSMFAKCVKSEKKSLKMLHYGNFFPHEGGPGPLSAMDFDKNTYFRGSECP